MIAFEVRINGKRVCVAGAEDLAVLTATVSACGKLGARTVPARPDDESGEVFYSVTGLTARPDPENDVHMRWRSVEPLQIGDVLEVRIIDAEKTDRLKSRVKAGRGRKS
jgi:hypothetical protein